MRNRFAPLLNTQDEVLDKEAKNYREKETLQCRHQTPVYRKQNHQPNPIINHFPENDYHFWQQRTVPGNSKYSDTVKWQENVHSRYKHGKRLHDERCK